MKYCNNKKHRFFFLSVPVMFACKYVCKRAHKHTHTTHKSFHDCLVFSANIYFTFKFKLCIEHYIIKQSSLSCIVDTFFSVIFFFFKFFISTAHFLPIYLLFLNLLSFVNFSACMLRMGLLIREICIPLHVKPFQHCLNRSSIFL